MSTSTVACRGTASARSGTASTPATVHRARAGPPRTLSLSLSLSLGQWARGRRRHRTRRRRHDDARGGAAPAPAPSTLHTHTPDLVPQTAYRPPDISPAPDALRGAHSLRCAGGARVPEARSRRPPSAPRCTPSHTPAVFPCTRPRSPPRPTPHTAHIERRTSRRPQARRRQGAHSTIYPPSPSSLSHAVIVFVLSPFARVILPCRSTGWHTPPHAPPRPAVKVVREPGPAGRGAAARAMPTARILRLR